MLILIVAALSGCAGALLTLLAVYLTAGDEREMAGGADELLSVIRTEDGPAVFVRGKRLRRLHEIEDRETGEETVAAIKAVLSFAEGWLPALKDRQASNSSTAGPPVPDSVDPTPLEEQGVQVATEGEPDASLSGPLDLVQEIDSLLQERLQERPDLAEMEIRMARDVQGRPLIYVGPERYRSAEEVPDETISAFIRETIRLWERE
ncbi:MAG: hypothetical protein PVH50_00865 [Anaerolineae bacterium]